MPEVSVKKGSELTDQNKVVSLFKFIQELNKLKQKAVLNVKDYPWFFALSRLPDDPENITLQYRDRVENEEPGVSATLLSVRKPEFKKCPEPDPVFRDWLEPGWDSYKQSATVRETREAIEEHRPLLSLFGEKEGEEAKPEHFSDSEERVKAFEEWQEKRAAWAEKQRVTAQTRNLFADLYRLYFELQKESETEEIIVANGMLFDRSNKDIRHPVLTHRVKLDYDPDRNIASIEDTDAPSELYSVVFQMMEDINLSAINQLNADLQANDFHPLDRNDTPGFLKVLVHQLSSESIFCEGVAPERWYAEGRLLLSMEPCFIVRKRLDGTLKAIEQIIENVQETGEVPAPIHDIVSGGMIEIPEDLGVETVEEQLAAVGGESVDILLSKEANKEQLEIARRIERYNAVLVQGPPGTGKTHTIANLMGHFLALGKSVLVTSYTRKALSVLKEKVAPGLQDLCVSLLDDSNVDMERSVDGITDYMSRTTSFELKNEMDALAAERQDIIDQLARVRRNIFAIIQQECGSIVLNGESISPSKAAAFVSERAEDLSYIPGSVRLHAPLPLSFEQLKDLYRSNEGISEPDEEELKCGIPDPAGILSPSDFEQIWTALQAAKGEISSTEQKKNWRVHLDENEGRVELTGGFGKLSFRLTDDETLHALKDYNASFGQIGQWMKCAAVDGKNGGAYRQRWITLIDQIRSTCEYAESVVAEQFGKTIEIAPDADDALRRTYEKIRGVLASKGKLSWFDLTFNKDIEPALSKSGVDGHPVQTAEECDIILHCMELNSMRKQCALYWNELLAPNGIPEFSTLDARRPESIAANMLPQIERYLDWYHTDYQRLADLLEEAGLSSDTLFMKDTLDSDLVATGKILDAVDHIIPSVCDVYGAALRIREKTALLAATKQILLSGQRAGSQTCRRVVEMMDGGDVSGYADAFATLEKLYEKYALQSSRGELLHELEPFAPQWAEAIRARVGIHGQAIVPETIEDAWKWKQLSGIVAEITAQPFEALQAESLRLSKEYRDTTARYAEKSGWYHLLRRTEADIDMKQALQGWKQTVKRIGKGTGKTAPALKAKARELMTKCQSAVPGWIMPINRALDSLNPKSNRFDIIIIDEASQSDVSSLAILYMGRKLIIVGDDKQVSPMAIGVEADKMSALEQMYIKDKIPNSHLYNAKTSIYDIAATTFQPLMLREHFRCVPEIIGFSNMLSYDYKIKPLRDASNSVLLPAVVNYRVANGHREHNKTNPNEAKAIVALMQACIDQPEYAGKSMGVISLLGDEQVKLIQQLIEKKINPKETVRRNILCGNSANFQGDERDVIFLSVVDSGDGNGPIHMQNFGPDDAIRKRYNVAASRARDQLWVVDSLDPASDLKPGDIRKTLIEYSINPQASDVRRAEIEAHAESPFEAGVAKTLSDRGYHLVQQWKVGAYRLDMVAVCGKKTVAIECDGERWHSGETKVREDMERQTILERLGWRFIRIRGSEYFRNPEKTMERVIRELSSFGIEPEESNSAPAESRTSELFQRVKSQAELALLKENGQAIESIEDTIAGALDPKRVIRELLKTPSPLPQVPAQKNTISERSEGIGDQASATEFGERKGADAQNPQREREQANAETVDSRKNERGERGEAGTQNKHTGSILSAIEESEKTPQSPKNSTHNHDDRTSFSRWLEDDKKLSARDSRSVVSALSISQMFLQENITPKLSLFSTVPGVVKDSIRVLLSDPVFSKKNDERGGRYFDALVKLNEFNQRNESASTNIMEFVVPVVDEKADEEKTGSVEEALSAKGVPYWKAAKNYLFIEKKNAPDDVMRAIRKCSDIISVTSVRRYGNDCWRIRLYEENPVMQEDSHKTESNRDKFQQDTANKISLSSEKTEPVTNAEPKLGISSSEQADNSVTEQMVIPEVEKPQQKPANVIALLKQNKIKYVDKRQSNGALWIIGGRELDPIVRECRKLGVYFRYKADGGRQTGFKPGWWAK